MWSILKPSLTYLFYFYRNIDDITRFEVTDKSKSGSSFSYNMKQLISREVELEKVRRTESLRKDTVENPNPSPRPKPKAEAKKEEAKSVHTPERSVPNHLQRLTPKQIKVEDSEPVSIYSKIATLRTYFFLFRKTSGEKGRGGRL